MRLASLPRLAVIAALGIVAGCSSNTDKIEGLWSSEAATIHGEEMPAGARILQLGKDGHLIYTVAGRTYKGNYTLGMGLSVTFTLDEEFEGRRIHPYKINVDEDQLSLLSADGSKLIFKRAKPPATP